MAATIIINKLLCYVYFYRGLSNSRKVVLGYIAVKIADAKLLLLQEFREDVKDTAYVTERQ
jgi:hypothetical protein